MGYNVCFEPNFLIWAVICHSILLAHQRNIRVYIWVMESDFPLPGEAIINDSESSVPYLTQ